MVDVAAAVDVACGGPRAIRGRCSSEVSGLATSPPTRLMVLAGLLRACARFAPQRVRRIAAKDGQLLYVLGQLFRDCPATSGQLRSPLGSSGVWHVWGASCEEVFLRVHQVVGKTGPKSEGGGAPKVWSELVSSGSDLDQSHCRQHHV